MSRNTSRSGPPPPASHEEISEWFPHLPVFGVMLCVILLRERSQRNTKVKCMDCCTQTYLRAFSIRNTLQTHHILLLWRQTFPWLLPPSGTEHDLSNLSPVKIKGDVKRAHSQQITDRLRQATWPPQQTSICGESNDLGRQQELGVDLTCSYVHCKFLQEVLHLNESLSNPVHDPQFVGCSDPEDDISWPQLKLPSRPGSTTVDQAQVWKPRPTWCARTRSEKHHKQNVYSALNFTTVKFLPLSGLSVQELLTIRSLQSPVYLCEFLLSSISFRLVEGGTSRHLCPPSTPQKQSINTAQGPFC